MAGIWDDIAANVLVCIFHWSIIRKVQLDTRGMKWNARSEAIWGGRSRLYVVEVAG